MFCAECGKPVSATAKHCVYCGTPVGAAEGAAPASLPIVPPPLPPALVPPAAGPPAPRAVVPPPVPPAAYGFPPPPGYAAPSYPGTQAAGRGALGWRYAGAGCFVIALIGSFLPFMTASAIGADADDAGTWFMLWRDTGWGPVIAVLIILALICSIIPKRGTALAAALLSIPAIVLIPVRGSVYRGLGVLGIDIGFGAGFFLLLVLAAAGCALCFVTFARMRRRVAPPAWR